MSQRCAFVRLEGILHGTKTSCILVLQLHCAVFVMTKMDSYDIQNYSILQLLIFV